MKRGDSVYVPKRPYPNCEDQFIPPIRGMIHAIRDDEIVIREFKTWAFRTVPKELVKVQPKHSSLAALEMRLNIARREKNEALEKKLRQKIDKMTARLAKQGKPDFWEKKNDK